ncbi:2-amino-4-hydroxy-6-hydroxymethyldihydropteridine diphosphokinase [Nannocystis bainbridge]|uniref:2-amino-4-hydroxy-6-hydroxymethyldihydropteridine pyrophosphokinase n=1 Tax=Nannocystis bainbridge TaxID=2995303 RepID=A0ABT5DYM5_9BACT|nr:2-amino-4-hydroxy-6-hydroxymethyldihydropteridine diphosphokinase [Nannocystis bainbridge]MDC0718671.1 2-amino-4-hydroxy-6-hydroxymethyldihydropteridine diphosphokinase [Nannocystis bainbridge]
MTSALAYVGLGSNLGERLDTLRGAAEALRAGVIAGTELLRCSPVFETRPLGPSLHPFLNAVVELRTTLAPAELLTGLLALEARHGRTRRERWEARTLDLDLLVMTEDGRSLQVDSERLVLPHPELARRDFVLAPLAALRPDLRPRGGATAAELLAALAPEARTILAHGGPPLC